MRESTRYAAAAIAMCVAMLTAQTPDPQQTLAEARALLAKKEREKAAAHLRSALVDADLGAGAGELRALLATIDPQDATRRHAEEAAARPLLEVAALLRDRGWDDAGEVVRGWLRGLEAGLKPAATDPGSAPPAIPPLQVWFRDAEPATAEQDWRWLEDRLLSPVRSFGSTSILYSGLRGVASAKAQFELEFVPPEGALHVALLLGCVSATDRCLEVGWQRTTDGGSAVYVLRRGGVPLNPIRLELPRPAPGALLRLAAQLDGETLRVTVGDGPPIDVLVSRSDLDGLLAIKVHQSGELTAPVEFPRLVAEGWTAVLPPTEVEVVAAAPAGGPLQRLQVLDGRAVAGLRETDLLELLRLSDEAATLGENDRMRLERGCDALLRRIDPRLSGLALQRRESARVLVPLVQAWRRANWNHTALRYAEIVAQLDPRVGSPLVERLAPRRGSAATVPAEPAPEPEEDLVAWFGSGKRGWRVFAQRVASPQLVEIATAALESQRELPPGEYAISIELRAPTEGAKAGIAFATDGVERGYVVDYELGAVESILVLSELTGDQIAKFHAEAICTLTRAERAAFIPIRIEVRGVEVKVFTHGQLVLAHRLETPVERGRLMLFVSGDSPRREPVDFQRLRVTRL